VDSEVASRGSEDDVSVWWAEIVHGHSCAAIRTRHKINERFMMSFISACVLYVSDPS